MIQPMRSDLGEPRGYLVCGIFYYMNLFENKNGHFKILPKKEVKHPQPALKRQESAASGICNLLTLYNLSL